MRTRIRRVWVFQAVGLRHVRHPTTGPRDQLILSQESVASKVVLTPKFKELPVLNRQPTSQDELQRELDLWRDCSNKGMPKCSENK